MVEENPAQARKRRIQQRRAALRASVEDDSACPETKRARLSGVDDEEDATAFSESDERASPSVRGIKRQTRYEPGVPMTKEELQKWRKQARRVRNRESAAASRQKTRERISELEIEVSDLQAELAKAHARITELEAASKASPPTVDIVVKSDPLISKKATMSPRPARDVSQVSPAPSPTVSPRISPQSPRSLSLPEDFSLDSCRSSVSLPTMISRPTAV